MRKSRLIITILLVSVILSLFSGCQSPVTDATQGTAPSTEPSQSIGATDPSDEVTEPSSEATEPSVPENLELTLENIQTYVKEGLTYAQLKTMFGFEHARMPDSAYMDARIHAAWFLDENGFNGTYLEIRFKFPGYDTLYQWLDTLNLPTETQSNGAYYYVGTNDYLDEWVDNMEAVGASICENSKTVEVLFGEAYYDSSVEPSETSGLHTIEFFKSHLTPYMTYREAKEIFGRKDTDTSDSNNWREAIWNLEDGYFVEVLFYPTANMYMEEYLATEPTGETNPDGTPLDGLYYYGEWNNHMEAYCATLYKGSTTGKKEKIEVWFEYPNPWVPEE